MEASPPATAAKIIVTTLITMKVVGNGGFTHSGLSDSNRGLLMDCSLEFPQNLFSEIGS